MNDCVGYHEICEYYVCFQLTFYVNIVSHNASPCFLFFVHFSCVGFGWEKVRMLNPDLIFCSISGFGQTGPDSRLAAVDTIIQATSGIMSVTSTEANGPPTRAGVSVSDMMAGM
jgi:hypothetical protein